MFSNILSAHLYFYLSIFVYVKGAASLGCLNLFETAPSLNWQRSVSQRLASKGEALTLQMDMPNYMKSATFSAVISVLAICMLSGF